MTLMTGMTPKDAMGGMPMMKWMFMDLGIARLDFNRQGGPSGARVGESTNWNMAMVQRTIGPGLFTVMMMNSLEQRGQWTEGYRPPRTWKDWTPAGLVQAFLIALHAEMHDFPLSICLLTRHGFEADLGNRDLRPSPRKG
jgi:hypothetical protein